MAVLTMAHLATPEIDLGRESNARNTLVRDHQEAVSQLNSYQLICVAEKREQLPLLLNWPDVYIA